jgi:hypothetical protein
MATHWDTAQPSGFAGILVAREMHSWIETPGIGIKE